MSSLSSTVSETNRQRIALGMAPLADGSRPAAAAASSSSATSTAAAAASSESDHADLERIRQELAARKEKRALQSKVTSRSLGESLISETAGSAAKWIERSKQLGMSEANRAAAHVASIEAAERAAINDDAYTSADLVGAKIAHSASDFASANDGVILTLKDTRLLTGVSSGLNEDEDELMNQDLADAERQKVINDRRKHQKASNAAKTRYDIYGEEESELLAKYSDDTDTKNQGLRLGAGGALTASDIDAQKNHALYAQDAARREANQLVYSLDDTIGGEKERTFQSDYKQVKFKKKKKGAAVSEQTKETTNGKDEIDSTTTATDSSAPTTTFKKKTNGSSRNTKAPTSTFDFLSEPTADERANDFASRSGVSARSARESAEEAEQQARKDERYMRAIQAAEEKTRQRNELDAAEKAQKAIENAAKPAGQIVPPPPKSAPPTEAFRVPPPPPPPTVPVTVVFEEEDDAVLAASLARARRLAQQKKESEAANTGKEAAPTSAASSSSISSNDASIRALADRVKEEEKVRVKVESSDDTTMTPTSLATAAAGSSSSSLPIAALARAPPGMSLKAPAEGIVLTTTTEFVRGLQADQVSKSIKKEANGHATASDGVQPMDLDVKPSINGTAHVEEEFKSVDDMQDDGGDRGADEDDDNDDDDDGDYDAEATHLLGVSSALKLLRSRGLLKDGGHRTSTTDHYGAEKYDAFGHEQSKKEQFRFISHRFHGIEASLNKQEKRLNKVQVEAQRRQMLNEQGGIINKLAEKQLISGSAHVVMDKKFTAEITSKNTGASAASSSSQQQGKKRKKESGPFAAFGHGKGGFAKKRKHQLADAAKKAATTVSSSGMEQ